MDERGHSPAALVVAARTLALEAAAGEVVAGWRRDGIESVVLKGPTIASWLYSDPDSLRGYVDIDLLVDPARLFDAADVLRRLGFEPHHESLALHSHPWVRASDGAVIDLHVGLWGALRPAGDAWRELCRDRVVQPLAATEAMALGLPGRALHVVLHAAQHADKAPPREDLRRALAVLDEDGWNEAFELADRLWALEATVAGLALEPDGARLIECHPLLRAAAMRARGDAPLAIGISRVLSTHGSRAKLVRLVGLLLAAERDPRRGGRKPARGRWATVQRVRWSVALIGDFVRTLRTIRRARRG